MAHVVVWIWMAIVGAILGSLAVLIVLGTYYRNESLVQRIFAKHKPDRS